MFEKLARTFVRVAFGWIRRQEHRVQVRGTSSIRGGISGVLSFSPYIKYSNEGARRNLLRDVPSAGFARSEKYYH